MEIFDWIDSQRERMISLVQQWASVNSYTHNLEGLARMREMLMKEFSVLGGEMREIEVGPRWVINSRGDKESRPLGKAISIRKRSAARDRVFLCIHMDTVYPPESGFNEVIRADEKIMRGPGVTDAKGGLAVMLVALEAFERSPLAQRIGWEVLINSDEEVASPGSYPLFEEAARRNDVGLLFEPAMPDGSMVSDRKGSGNYTIVVHGRAAHAGRVIDEGRNAIVAMAEFITRLQRMHEPPGLTINVGQIEGGGPVNVVPDLAIMRFNFRSLAPSRPLHEYVQQMVAEINAREGFAASWHGGVTAPRKILDVRTQKLIRAFDRCAEELGLKLAWKQSGGVSDGNRLASHGLPNIDSLGPRGGEIHSSKEFLLVDSLTEKAKLTSSFLMKFAENGLHGLFGEP